MLTFLQNATYYKCKFPSHTLIIFDVKQQGESSMLVMFLMHPLVSSLSISCLAYFVVIDLKNTLNVHFMCFGNKLTEVYCNYIV